MIDLVVDQYEISFIQGLDVRKSLLGHCECLEDSYLDSPCQAQAFQHDTVSPAARLSHTAAIMTIGHHTIVITRCTIVITNKTIVTCRCNCDHRSLYNHDHQMYNRDHKQDNRDNFSAVGFSKLTGSSPGGWMVHVLRLRHHRMLQRFRPSPPPWRSHWYTTLSPHPPHIAAWTCAQRTKILLLGFWERHSVTGREKDSLFSFLLHACTHCIVQEHCYRAVATSPQTCNCRCHLWLRGKIPHARGGMFQPPSGCISPETTIVIMTPIQSWSPGVQSWSQTR